jgi:S1-C subfamily serine protease
VNVVGPGTPAAEAKGPSPGAGDGLRAGDIIRRIDGAQVQDAIDVDRFLAGTKPGQTVQIAVARGGGDRPKEVTLTATLTAPPLSIVRPELQPAGDRTA